jgi:hypothetical protein
MKKRVAAIFSILLLCLALSGCLGPKPVLESYTATPPGPGSGDPFRVEAVVANKGPGEGQVEVEVNLKDKQNGAILAADSRLVDLQRDGTEHVLFELELPPSAKDLDPKNIDVEVDAHYPVE